MSNQSITAVCMDSRDTVVTVTKEIEVGETVVWRDGDEMRSVVSSAKIPIYHKIAVLPVEKGGYVLKYGEKIGVATQEIQPGQHVHVHNLVSEGR